MPDPVRGGLVASSATRLYSCSSPTIPLVPGIPLEGGAIVVFEVVQSPLPNLGCSLRLRLAGFGGGVCPAFWFD